MKPSHLSTPRTLSEATFYSGCDPIERPPQPDMDDGDKAIVVVGLFFIFVVVVLVLKGY
jgi:hypothetical protein